MDENDIKAAVLSRIRKQSRGRALPIVTSEFSLKGTGIRADLAILNGQFTGVEIKSSGDTLKRLPSQMEGYARYFDHTLLVVAPKHLRGLRDIDLHGAEVWRQEVLSDWMMHQLGEQRKISGHWLLQLLTIEEERRATRDLAKTGSISADAQDAYYRSAFEAAFRRRYAETSAAFWQAVAGRQIRPDDLTLLSRFYADRQHAKQAAADSDLMWARWTEQMTAIASNS
jgi:hypothetical protein